MLSPNITLRGNSTTKSGYTQITVRDLLSRMDIGKKIQKARKRSGLSQTALGAECGWEKPQTRISNYETGTREPSLGDLEKIAGVLGLTLVDLISYDEAAPPTPRTPKEQAFVDLLRDMDARDVFELLDLMEVKLKRGGRDPTELIKIIRGAMEQTDIKARKVTS